MQVIKRTETVMVVQYRKFANDIFNIKMNSELSLLHFANITFISHPGVCIVFPVDAS